MDSHWQEWRHIDEVWERLEEKGWELGPVKYIGLPFVVAEFGPYFIAFRYRNGDTGDSLFELREMHEGEERRAVIVWGIPTPAEAEELLERYGVAPDGSPADPCADSVGLWGGILPPVVNVQEYVRSGD